MPPRTRRLEPTPDHGEWPASPACPRRQDGIRDRRGRRRGTAACYSTGRFLGLGLLPARATGLALAAWTGAGATRVLVSLAVGTLLSEDLACVTAGLMVGAGQLSFAAATIACAVGILAGDLTLFGGGALLSRLGMSQLLRRLGGEERLRAGVGWACRHGATAALTSRFLPGTRTATFFALGALLAGSPAADAAIGAAQTADAGQRARARTRVLTTFAVGVVIWTPLLVGFAATTGGAALRRLERYRAWALPIAGLLVVVMWLGARGVEALIAAQLRRRRVTAVVPAGEETGPGGDPAPPSAGSVDAAPARDVAAESD